MPDESSELRTALASTQAQLNSLQTTARESAKSAALATVLAEHSIVPGGASQLTELLRDQLTVAQDGSQLVVVGPAFRPVGEFIREQLASPRYAHFLTTGARAAAASGSTSAAPVATGQPAGGEPTLQDQIIQGYARINAARPAAGDPRLDPTLPFGLRRLR